jgi:hypothetical protein
MLVTLLPIEALVRLKQESNAANPMLVTLSGIVTPLTLPLWNDLSPIPELLTWYLTKMSAFFWFLPQKSSRIA